MMSRVLNVLLVVVAILAVSQTANATAIFQDGFEAAPVVSHNTTAEQDADAGLIVSALPANPTVGAGYSFFTSTLGNSPKQIQVTDLKQYAGDNSLRIQRYTHAAVMGSTTSKVSTGLVHAEFMLYIPSTNPAGGWAAQIYLGDSTGQANGGFGGQGAEGYYGSNVAIMVDTGQTALGDSGIAIHVNNTRLGGEGFTGFIGLMAKKNLWQKYEIDLNLATQTWTLKLDGVAANQSFGYNNAGITSVNNILFRGAQGGNQYYVDDVLVTPEPATLAILGLGGLFLRRRYAK